MNNQEYKKVKKYKYLQYCEYLKQKYGEPSCNYFTPSYNKNKKISRAQEGLICHHICENKAIKLSTPEYAKKYPFEYQESKNLCYCDYLEHLFLHILICEEYLVLTPKDHTLVGIGGIVNYIIPELNDLYSGWETNQLWRKKCHDKVKNDKDVYLQLLKRFIEENCIIIPFYQLRLSTSLSDRFPSNWASSRDVEIFKIIENYVDDYCDVFYEDFGTLRNGPPINVSM